MPFATHTNNAYIQYRLFHTIILGGIMAVSFTDTNCQSQQVVALQELIATNGFELVFQPKFRCSDRAVAGIEVLARWPGAHHYWQQPDHFVRMAEQQSLSPALDLQVLSKTLETLRALPPWLRHVLGPVSVNVSAHSVMDTYFIEEIAHLFSSGKNPNIHFELTETASLYCLKRACEAFTLFSRLGISLSIDDFLHGYNTLGVLEALPAKEIKIDRKDIATIHERTGFRRVTSMITIAKQKQIQITAEGIENEGQWSLLKSMGCDFCQGFWLSEPLPAEELSTLR